MPSSQIYEIIQDQKGYIWFGTDNGVVRFNGYDFDIFNTNDGLASPVIFYLDEAPNGNIWAYGANRTLSYFDGERFNSFRYNDSIFNNISSANKPMGINVDKESISISFTGGKNSNQIKEFPNVIRFSPDAGISSDFGLEDKYVILLDLDEDLSGIRFDSWDGQKKNHQILVMVKEKDHFSVDTLKSEEFSGVNLTNARNPIARCCRINGQFYFSAEYSLFGIDQGKIRQIATFDYPIIELSPSPSPDEILVGTSNGVFELDTRTGEVFKHFLTGKWVSSINLDKDDGIWFGTLYNGLYYLSPHTSTVYNTTNNLMIQSLVGNENKIYFTTRNGSLYKLVNGKANRVFDHENTPSFFSKLDFVSQNQILYRINAKTIIIHPDTDQLEKLPYTVGSGEITSLSDTTFLLANKGMAIVHTVENGRSDTILYSRISGIKCAYQTSQNETFIGTEKGLIKVADTTKEQPFAHIPFFNSEITDIFSPDNRTFFFASKTAGLMIQDQRNNFYNLNKEKGLVSNNITGLYYAEDKLFVYSKSGLSIISKDTSIYNLTHKNFLSSNIITGLFCRNDTLWIAHDRGLDRISLNFQTEKQAPLYFADMVINGESRGIANTYEMNFKHSEIRFSIEALSYPHLGDISYRYKLLGHDINWNESNNSEVRYTHIQPGEYPFLLSYKSRDGIWSTPQKMFLLRKNNPYWKRWEFILLSVLFLLSIVFVISLMWIKWVRNKANAKYHLIDLERKALQSQMNPHFIFNALTSIQSLIVEKKSTEAVKYLVNFSKITRLALTHSSEKFVSLHNELILLNNYVELEQLRFEDQFDFELINRVRSADIFIPPTVIQPFVENAILHGLIEKEGKGKLTVRLHEGPIGFIHCEVEDNGIGRKNVIRSRHNSPSLGVKLIKERLDLLVGYKTDCITFIDKENPTGTIVKLIIPTQKTHENSFN